MLNLGWLRSEPELRSRCAAEDDKLGLEEDIPKDGEPDPSVGLDTAKANGVGDRCIVHVATWDHSLVGTNAKRDARESRTAGKSVSTLGVVKFGPGNLVIVCGNNILGEVEEGGTSVGNGVDGGGDESTATDCVTVAGELPEAFGAVDVDVSDASGVLGCVNVAEVVATWGTFLQVCGEEGRLKSCLGIGEECLLRGR